MKNHNDKVDFSTLYAAFVRLKKKIKQLEIKPKLKKRR